MPQTQTNLSGKWKAELALRAPNVLWDAFHHKLQKAVIAPFCCHHLDVEGVGSCLSPAVDRAIECPIYYPPPSSSTSLVNCLTSCMKLVQMDSSLSIGSAVVMLYINSGPPRAPTGKTGTILPDAHLSCNERDRNLISQQWTRCI